MLLAVFPTSDPNSSASGSNVDRVSYYDMLQRERCEELADAVHDLVWPETIGEERADALHAGLAGDGAIRAKCVECRGEGVGLHGCPNHPGLLDGPMQTHDAVLFPSAARNDEAKKRLA